MGDNLNEASSSFAISLVTVDDSRQSKEDDPINTVTTSPSKTTPTLPLQVQNL